MMSTTDSHVSPSSQFEECRSPKACVLWCHKHSTPPATVTALHALMAAPRDSTAIFHGIYIAINMDARSLVMRFEEGRSSNEAAPLWPALLPRPTKANAHKSIQLPIDNSTLHSYQTAAHIHTRSTRAETHTQQKQQQVLTASMQALRGPTRASQAARQGAQQAQKALGTPCVRRSRAGTASRASAASSPLQAAEDERVDHEKRDIQQMLNRPYKYGFQTFIESDTFPKGLDEDVVRAISAKKGEPEWMLEFRLRAFRKWLTMEEPVWSDNRHPPINFQDVSYYSQPKMKEKKASLDEVDPELLRTFDKLGIPLNEQKRLANVAVDAVFDSVSIATTFREELGRAGVIFCSISEAVKDYPDLIRKYLGSVVRGLLAV